MLDGTTLKTLSLAKEGTGKCNVIQVSSGVSVEKLYAHNVFSFESE